MEQLGLGRFDNSMEARLYYCYCCDKETFLAHRNRARHDQIEYKALCPGATRVIFGIHPEQIKPSYYYEPLRQEIFTFCGYHGNKFFGNLTSAVAQSLNKCYFLSSSKVSNDFRNNLSKTIEHWVISANVDMPDYEPGYGHWITYIADGFLRFNIQMVEPVFNSVLEALPNLFGESIDYLCKLNYIPAGIFPPKYFNIDNLSELNV